MSDIEPQAVEALLDAAFGTDRFGRTAYRIRAGVDAVPALIMLVGAVNMFGVDAAAGRAAETLVSNEASPAPAEAAILPAEPERLE